MQSWERAVFSPRFLGILYKTGSKVKCEDYGMAVSIGTSCIGKIPPTTVFWFCPMRRRSLRLLSPDRLHNSDENRRLERGWYRPSELPSQEDLTREAGLMMDFYGGIWKNVLSAQENCNHFA